MGKVEEINMSDLKELKKKYRELGKEIKRLEEKQSIENDPIFLLSTEEYEKYKDKIPQINCWWWLRSPGTNSSNYAANVFYDGSVDYYGHFVNYGYGAAVRPALRIARPEKYNIQIGMKIIRYDFPWIVIDKDLAIAEVPIAFRRFSKKSNNYENSEIRKFLLEWFEEVE